MAVNLPAAKWRQWTWGGGRDPVAAFAAVSLTVIAALLLTLALSGGGRELGPWTTFRLVIFGLFAAAIIGGRIRRTALGFPLVGVLAAVAVTSIGSVRPQTSLDQFVAWGAYAATCLVVASAISSREAARRFVDAAVFSGGVLSLVGLYFFWGAGNPTMRWSSTFYWPNPFAGFLLLVLPVEILRCVLAVSRREALTHGAMTVLLATAFVLTFSRGAWAAATLALGLAAVVVRRSLHRLAAVRAAVLLLAVAATVYALTQGQAFQSSSGSVLARAASTADLNEYSLQGRLHFLRGAVEIFRDHPVLGTGPGTFTYVYPQYQRDVRFYARDPHNLFAQMAAEAGVVGLIALVALMAALAAMALRTTRRARGTPEFPSVAGVAAGLAAFWIHTGMEMNWSFPAAPAMAFALMGILAWHDSAPIEGANVLQDRSFGERLCGLLSPKPEQGVQFTQGASKHGPPKWTRIALSSVVLLVMSGMLLQYAAVTEFQVGRAAFGAGQWSVAADAFRRASALNPLDPRYPSALADALSKAGAAPTAVMHLVRRANSLDRANPYYWVQLAALSDQASTPTTSREAEAALRTAIALDPFHYAEAYRHLAALYRRRRDPAGALEVYRQAAARYPDSVAEDFVLRPMLWPGVVPLLMDWADLLVEQHRDAEAQEVYGRIVLHEPSFTPAYARSAQLHLRTGRLRDAARVLAAGLKHVPNDRQLQALARELRTTAPDTFPQEDGR